MTDIRIRETRSSDSAQLAALAVLPAGVALLWWWIGFSGLFRALIDLQIRWFGHYWEILAGAALALLLAVAAWLLVILLGRLPRLSYRSAEVLLGLQMVLVGAFLGAAGLRQWSFASHLPSFKGSARVVDLDEIGSDAIPSAYVRVIGVPYHRHQTVQCSTGQHHTCVVYTPIVGRHERPVWLGLLAYGKSKYLEDALRLPATLQGVVVADGLSPREIYQLRAGGVPLANHTSVLVFDDRYATDLYIDAGLLIFFGLVTWGCIGYTAIRGTKPAAAAVDAPSVSPPPPPIEALPTPPSEQEEPETPSSRFRYFLGVAALLAVGAAWFLWKNFWLLPGRTVLIISAIIVVVLGVAFLLLEFLPDSSSAPATSSPFVENPAAQAGLTPQPGATLLCVMRDEPLNGNAYFRVDVDGAPMTTLKANRYATVALRPGMHVLAANVRASIGADVTVSFSSAPGEIIVYQLQVPFFGRPSLERLTDLDAVHATLARHKPA